MRIRVLTGLIVLAVVAGTVSAETPHSADTAADTRLVVIKVDGLPQSLVDAYVNRENARTGRSELPWIRHLFYESGIRAANFYSRGISLSEPSWAVIDTGQHSIIKGNFEVDRNTGDAADHLSFVGYYVESVKSQRVFPAGVETLDACRTPLTSDAWQEEDREIGIQLLRRGTRWFELLKVGVDPVRRGKVGERVGDLLVGVSETEVWAKVSEERFITALLNPRLRYVDFYWPYIDEAIHDDSSNASLRTVLTKFDAMLGRAQQAIADSGTADRTVLVVVSDHGATFDGDNRYSQGINLIASLERPEFGAHNTMTRGGPLANYELKGSALSPFASSASVTSSKFSSYLADRPEQITCALDYDGNERAQIHFRDPDLNRLQMLWRALRNERLDAAKAAAAGRGALAILDRRRAAWAAEAAALTEELRAVQRKLIALRSEHLRLTTAIETSKKNRATPGSSDLLPFSGVSTLNYRNPHQDLVQRSREIGAELFQVGKLLLDYGAHRDRLITRTRISTPEDFVAAPESALFGFRDLGRPLTVEDLLAYPFRLRDVVTDANGNFDELASFDTVNYVDAFMGIRVRNSPSAERGTEPVEWLVAEVGAASVTATLAQSGYQLGQSDRVFLVHGGGNRQLLMICGSTDTGPWTAALRPISEFSIDRKSGAASFTTTTWRAGLPFGLLEDANLDTGGVDRTTWLSMVHTANEWRDATHRTAEGLAVVGLTEVYETNYRQSLGAAIEEATDADTKSLLRFEIRRRDAVGTDLFLHSSPHWNFDLKDFNPGGNHGGFGRESMHGVLWMRGGSRTRLVQGPTVIDRPYDGLDVAPTLFEAGGLTTSGVLTDELRRGRFRPFPGQIVREAFRP